MANKHPVEIDGITGEVETLPSQGKRYRAKLDTISDVKREMARCYKDARSQTIDVQDASRLVYMLAALGKVIESTDIETRIEALEALKK